MNIAGRTQILGSNPSGRGFWTRLKRHTTALGVAGLIATTLPTQLAAQESGISSSNPSVPEYGESVPQLRPVRGMMMLDYTPMTLTDGSSFDLASYRYLQRANDWLSYGFGAFAPLVQGNVGGFYGFEASLHAQRNFGRSNWFWNAGLSMGVGAGGDSVAGIRRFSGQGLFGRAYFGLGYQTRYGNFGINYSRVTIQGSPINASAFTLFMQRPLGFSVGSHSDSGRTLRADQFESPRAQNILSFHLSSIRQINPTGSYRGNIGVMSPQFTHFLTRDVYTFFGLEIGLSGLDWYNQTQGGFGRRFQLGPRTNLYAQLGIGSGGWVTDTIDTGAGLVIYPRLTFEYMLNDRVGAQLSAGYFWAPTGTSRNITLSAGLAYHMSRGRETNPETAQDEFTMHGVRLHTFARATSPIFYNGRTSEGLGLLSVQADYSLNRNWYASAQIAGAASSFRGIAGYVEGFFGLGWQSRPFANGRMQAYAQMLVGLNDVGVSSRHAVGPIVYPAIGLNYHFNDRVSLYGQIGATRSIGHRISSSITNRWSYNTVGLGMTYRFSLPFRS